MNFSIYMEDEVAKDLLTVAKKTGKSRNSLIMQAVRSYLKQLKKMEWPEEVRLLAGADKKLRPFEKFREELKAPKEDPFK